MKYQPDITSYVVNVGLNNRSGQKRVMDCLSERQAGEQHFQTVISSAVS